MSTPYQTPPTNRQKAILFGETLKNGTSTRRELCPKCGGGSSAEAGFLISRDSSGRVRWRCFRGSCGFKGAAGGTVGTVAGTSPEVGTSRPLTRPLQKLPAHLEAEYEEAFGYSPLPSLVRWEPEGGYYAHKVCSHLWSERGWHLRRYAWQGDGPPGPRADNFQNVTTSPFIAHFPRSGTVITANPRVVVVEDCASALKLSHLGINSVALLGTVLNLDRVYDILAAPYGANVVLALDRGTRDLELLYKNQYSFLFDSWTTWVLDVDLKEESQDRIFRAVLQGQTDFVSVP